MLAGDHFVRPALVGGGAPALFVRFRRDIRRLGGLRTYRPIPRVVVMAALLTVWREWVFRPVAATRFD